MDKTEYLQNPRPIPDGIYQFVNVIKQLKGVKEVILFGSSATDAWRQDSDWDLGIVCKGIYGRDIENYLRIKGISKEQIGKLNINAHVFMQDDIDRYKKDGKATGHPMRGVMMANMLSNGIHL